jgi:FKBP-type peptidyl-prolyl cis-trans isomerase
MKYTKLTIVTFVTFLITVGLTAQQPAVKTAPVTTAPAKLTTAADTVQYSLGAYIGSWLLNNSFTITNQILFKRGMDDVMQNKPRAIADSAIAPLVATYQLSLQSARSRQMEQQLFAALKGQPGVGVLPNGVNYIVVKVGTGLRPLAADTVVFNAIGIFPDGTVFEDTFQKKQSIKAATSNLIPGLSEAIQLMPEGSVWRVFIPSALAYGPTGVQNVIPPNTALVFDVTLMEVKAGRK